MIIILVTMILLWESYVRNITKWKWIKQNYNKYEYKLIRLSYHNYHMI